MLMKNKTHPSEKLPFDVRNLVQIPTLNNLGGKASEGHLEFPIAVVRPKVS